jgi:hypothetical protein
MTKKIRMAHSLNVVPCDEGQVHVEFLDKNGAVFAEAVLEMDEALDIGLEMVDIADEDFEEGAPEGATMQ